MNSVIDFIANNKLLTVLIIFVLSCIIVYLQSQTYNEYMDGQTTSVTSETPAVTQPVAPVVATTTVVAQSPPEVPNCCPCGADAKIAKLKETFVGVDKTINIMTKINNKDFYLAGIPVSKCDKYIKSPDDCTNNVLTLIESADIDALLPGYIAKLAQDTTRCNIENNVKCVTEKKAKNDTTPCPTEYSECARKRNFIHDFTIREITNPTGPNTYTLINSPDAVDTTNPVKNLVGQIGGANNNLQVCVDSAPDLNSNIVNVTLVPVEDINPGADIKFRIKYSRQLHKNGMLLNDEKGEKKLKTMYLGKCADVICKFNGKPLTRMCLFDDITDERILIFTAKVVA